MPTQHDRTAPPTDGSPERGGTATTFAVLRRHQGTLASATARVVGLSGLAWLLLTAAIFALAWPVFTQMRNQRLYYKYLEDPYLHDGSDLTLVTLWTLPLFLLLLGIGSAALQTVCSRTVAAETRGASPEDPSRAVVRSRRRAVLSVYALRGVIVWSLPLVASVVAYRLTGSQLDTPLPLERGSLAYELVDASPMAALFVAALLRLSLTLAPAAAADGLGPLAALRRSWSLTWTRAGLVRVLAFALPLAALTAGLVRLVTQLALPLRPAVRTLLEDATGNFFAAYYAGILAPVIVGILAAAAVVLPLAYTAFAALHERLRSRAEARGSMTQSG
ncbi:hypothetical protein ABZV77_20385 [Streptomyces sp. NPDC004732]|uniref:hypothetical protein n=1 Tax=Streptomyces sp. NPDC004732 TaxID=3154290 RepID=UPI0033A9EF4E